MEGVSNVIRKLTHFALNSLKIGPLCLMIIPKHNQNMNGVTVEEKCSVFNTSSAFNIGIT